MGSEQKSALMYLRIMFLHGLFDCFDMTPDMEYPQTNLYLLFLFLVHLSSYSCHMALVVSSWLFCIMACVWVDAGDGR